MMSEPAAVYRTRAACRAWDDGEDLSRYAAELRAARGVVTDPTRGYAQDTLEDAKSDWPEADRSALAEIQAAVREVLIGYHDGDDLDWIVEETLHQMRALLLGRGHLRLPMTAMLRVASDGRCYGCGVDGLRQEVHP